MIPADLVPELSQTSRWTVFAYPFKHVRAANVFDDASYDSLAKEFSNVLKGSASLSFAESQPGYDAQILPMRSDIAERFRPLFSRAWTELLAKVLKISYLPVIDAALHCIPQGSRSGWVHNDFCSAWLDGEVRDETVLFPDRLKCEYFSGKTFDGNLRPTEYVRTATMIFYLCNDGWSPGQGGETGLYAASNAHLGVVEPVPPLNNSLLLFECSPHSYHRLLTNPGASRNSVILWLHGTLDEALHKWPNGVTRRGPK